MQAGCTLHLGFAVRQGRWGLGVRSALTPKVRAAGGGTRAWLTGVLPLQPPPPLPLPPPPLQPEPVPENHQYQVWVWEAGGMAGTPQGRGGEGSRRPLGGAALTTTPHSRGLAERPLASPFPSRVALSSCVRGTHG